MPRRALLLPGLAGALIVIVLLAWGVPWLTRDRTDYTSTPTPPAFNTVTPVELRPGARACVSLVAFDPATRAATILTDKGTRNGPPLRVTATAPGYRSTAVVPGGYGGFASLQATLDAPPRSAIGEVCVENEGRRRVGLQGTEEGRIQNRSATTVDGRELRQKLTLLLGEGRARSLADRPGEVLDRMAAFKPPILGSAVLAVIGLLILAGVPAAVVYAIARSISEDESSGPSS